MATRVFANHHIVPNPHVLLAAHQDQGQSQNFTRLGGHARWIGHRLGQPLGRAWTGLALRFRKREVANRFQFPQRLQAAMALGVAARVVEVEFLAQEIGQLGPVDELAAVSQQPGDIGNGRRLRQSPLDLVLYNHAVSMRRNRNFVQHYLRVTGMAGAAIKTLFRIRLAQILTTERICVPSNDGNGIESAASGRSGRLDG